MSLPVNKCGFKLEEVTVLYGNTTALDAVTLSIEPEEAVALVGPSGAGKTTLLCLLNGTVPATSGRVIAHGREVASLSPGELRELRSRIGFIHQDLNLVPNLRVIRNVMSGRIGRYSLAEAIRSILFATRREAVKVHQILQQVGIAKKLYDSTSRLSGGQQQRVAIARALYQQPLSLLADEPVASVDPARARDMVVLLTKICREQGLTLCMSLHNLELARDHFHRLIGLRDGRIIFDRSSENLTDDDFARLYQLDQVEMCEEEARC